MKAAVRGAVDCAVVSCCCPCGLANLLFMATVKLPVHLIRKALAKRKTKRNSSKNSGAAPAADDDDYPTAGSPDAAELLFSRERSWEAKEEEIWEPFYRTGFWRTLSQQKRSNSPSY